MTRPLTPEQLGNRNRAARAVWQAVWLLLFRPTPSPLHGWRRFLLRLFGARIGSGAVIYPTATIWAPWNLEMGEGSCLSHHVDCYCVAKIVLGDHATVSQYAYLCSATRDISMSHMPLVVADIVIESNAWVAARAYIAPGITVHCGAVVGACAVVTKDVDAFTIVAGNPAKPIGHRKLDGSP